MRPDRTPVEKKRAKRTVSPVSPVRLWEKSRFGQPFMSYSSGESDEGGCGLAVEVGFDGFAKEVEGTAALLGAGGEQGPAAFPTRTEQRWRSAEPHGGNRVRRLSWGSLPPTSNHQRGTADGMDHRGRAKTTQELSQEVRQCAPQRSMQGEIEIHLRCVHPRDDFHARPL